MQRVEYILAHGSKNLFVTIDAVANDIDTSAPAAAEYVRRVCECFGSDGTLFVERNDAGYYVMNMYNTDGTQAEMCGNGMRIVARYVDERYLDADTFTLYSGGRPYPITRHAATAVVLDDGTTESIPNYGVAIAIRTHSEEFTLGGESFIAQRIEELHPTLEFTYLNLGNPHIVAVVESIDLELLTHLGERVKELTHIFTKGVNVSLIEHIAEGRIFVATYERGVGLTPSCGTAMTASSTAAALLRICRWGEEIEVRNRGGFVKCICSRNDAGEITTELIGNATYLEEGLITPATERIAQRKFEREDEAWSKIIEQL